MTDSGFLYCRYRFSGLDTSLLFPGNVQEILLGVFIENGMSLDSFHLCMVLRSAF